ncbi:TetR/AcrR family transcriptional regulator [Cryobacterium sp.]|jgi:AcrR family transcriptional regulator|uniref:TetR/AcrR family transcriptional regulator n=1 Tax=Cryobacterium sp. TaxID=1926290 RepID=UPI0026343475|nr:TetR/AcrR family transcriptional regulator [Cryobacterium sp.]MCU1446867.1 putative transcriptional regulator, TetR family protein [Cryobacterium sp.]
MDTVKSPRSYNSASRQAAARRNYDAILDAAGYRFIEAGYAGTTIAALADEAGVSAETIYKVFGGKPGIVRALYERGLAGRGPTAAHDRSDAMREQESDPHVLMRKWGELTAEVAGQVNPLLLLVRSAAATDRNMAALLEQSHDDRLQRMRHNARFLVERGYLREDVSFEEAVDVMWLHSSPELYDLLVQRRGWDAERFGRYVGRSMAAALLP